MIKVELEYLTHEWSSHSALFQSTDQFRYMIDSCNNTLLFEKLRYVPFNSEQKVFLAIQAGRNLQHASKGGKLSNATTSKCIWGNISTYPTIRNFCNVRLCDEVWMSKKTYRDERIFPFSVTNSITDLHRLIGCGCFLIFLLTSVCNILVGFGRWSFYQAHIMEQLCLVLGRLGPAKCLKQGPQLMWGAAKRV